MKSLWGLITIYKIHMNPITNAPNCMMYELSLCDDCDDAASNTEPDMEREMSGGAEAAVRAPMGGGKAALSAEKKSKEP